MDGTVQVRISIRKYTWHEFVHDVCFVLYATIVISNALCKRFFHLSIPQLYHRTIGPVVSVIRSAVDVFSSAILIIFFLLFGFFGILYTVGLPIVLALAALGKI